MDLVSGKNEIDEEEKVYLAAQELLGPRPKWQKIWDAL
jgi:amino acid transporter